MEKNAGEILGIRPYLYPQECLSSYLHRVANLNGVSSRELLFIFTKNKKDRLSNHTLYFRLDLMPTLYYDVNLLSKLLQKNWMGLKNHTLFNIYQKYSENVVYLSNILYETQKRKFCPLCIKENPGIYKLHWQLIDVSVCEKHNCELTNCCSICKTVQRYVFSSLGKGLCFGCNKVLKSKVIPCTKNNREKSIKVINDFYAMINLNKAFYPSIPGYDRNISVSLSLLYAVQLSMEKFTEPNKFDRSIVDTVIFSGVVAKILKSIINTQEYKLTLPLLINYLRKINMEFSFYTKITVPESYIKSVISYANKSKVLITKSKPKCMIKFCGNYKSERMIYKQNRGKKVYNKYPYSQPHICLGCFTPYGYNKSKVKWEVIDKSLALYREVLNDINKKQSIITIKKKLSLNSNEVYKTLGFLLRHSLLNEEAKRKYIIKVTEGKKSEEFIDKVETNNQVKLMRKLNIHPINFYYNYFTEDIQKRLFINRELTKEKDAEKILIISQAKQYIKESLADNINVTVENFCKKYKIKKSNKLYHKEALDIIKNTQKEVKKENNKKRETELIEVANKYCNSEITPFVYEVYQYLGLSPSTAKCCYPNLYQHISDTIKQGRYNQKLKNSRNN